MNARSITLLALITAAVLAIAGVATLVRRQGAPALNETLLLPALRARLNDAAKVTVKQAERTATLERRGETWTVAERDGYPAKFESIKALLVALGDLKGAEPKTASPALYPRIGVEDPALDNDATLVTVADASGATIAAIVLGDTASTGSAGARFVRAAEEAQSWLVNATINAPADPLAWVDREIIRLNAELIALVRTEHDGDTLAVVRGTGGAYSVEGLPEDRVAKPPTDLRRFAGAMSFLSFSDVARLDEAGVPSDARVTTFTRTDGVSLVVRSWSDGDERWITIGVTRPEGADLTEEARLQADDYAERFTGWRFALDEFRFSTLRPILDDLSVPRPPEGPPAEQGPEQAND